MANTKLLFKKGLSTGLPASGSYVPGTLYWTTDTHIIYLAESATSLIAYNGNGFVDIEPTSVASGKVLNFKKVDGTSIQLDLSAFTTLPEVNTAIETALAGLNGTATIGSDVDAGTNFASFTVTDVKQTNGEIGAGDTSKTYTFKGAGSVTVSATGNEIEIKGTDTGITGITEGNGISVTNTDTSSPTVSVKIDTTNANGLDVTSAGLKLNTATAGASAAASTAGAMTGAQAYKLEKIAVNTTNKSVTDGTNTLSNLVSDASYKHIDVTENSVSDGTTTISNIVSDDDYKHIDVTANSVSDGTNTVTVNDAELQFKFGEGTAYKVYSANTGTDKLISFDEGSKNGRISIDGNDVAVKGLAAAAYLGVSTEIPSTGAVDTKVATEKAVADAIKNLEGAMHYLGISTTPITDGGTQKPTIGGKVISELHSGDVVIYGDNKEFIYNGTVWEELGDEGAWVAKTRTIAGITLENDITTTALSTALAGNGLSVNATSGKIDAAIQSVSKKSGENLINVTGTTAKEISSTDKLINAVAKAETSVQPDDIANFKIKQTAKTDPTASGNATSFITTITQNENGEISATKKTIPTATNEILGLVKVDGSTINITAAGEISATQTVYTGGNGININANNVISADLTTNGGLILNGTTDGSKTIGVSVDGSTIKIDTTTGKLTAKNKVKGNETSATAVEVDPIVFDTANTNITVDSTSGDISFEWGTF